jgi:NAD-dependent dihydropyrimidine dehydrogenase PreA subunit
MVALVTTQTQARRNIIRIDQDKCDGCGDCIPNCPEGAIQLIDGKARLVGDLLCDGLGACLGHCPQGAITVEEREAAPYDEREVLANIVKQGPAVIQAHLRHLQDHNQTLYLEQAMNFLRDHNISLEPVPPKLAPVSQPPPGSGCPGSRAMSFEAKPASTTVSDGQRPSQLRHWPIQLHLLNPQAPHYHGSDLLLAADCVPFAVGDFHKDFLRGKTLAIACPKLDEGQDVYVQKLTALVDAAKVNTLTVIIMQVPCCQGLLRLAQAAVAQAQRKVPIKCVVVSLQGEILKDAWV